MLFRSTKKTIQKELYSERAKRGWITRRANQAAYQAMLGDESSLVVDVPGFIPQSKKKERGFSQVSKLLAKYGKTKDSNDYTDFRELKRIAYISLESDDAFDLIYEASLEAGWDEERSERFAKLS